LNKGAEKRNGSGEEVKNGEAREYLDENLSIYPEEVGSEVFSDDDAIPVIYDEEVERGES